MRDSSSDVVVIGAGPAGLAAGWRLAASGLKVVVLDDLGGVGGRLAGFELGGHRFDLEPVQFAVGGTGVTSPEVASAGTPGLDRVLDGLALRTVEYVQVLHLATGRSSLPPKPETGRWIPDPMNRHPAAVRRSARRLLRRRYGATTMRRVVAPMIEKRWGVDLERLDGSWILDRVQRSPLSAFSPHHLSVRRRMRTPVGGGVRMIDRVASSAVAAGVDLLPGLAPESIRWHGDRWRVTTSGTAAYEAPLVIAAWPVDRVARLLHPGPPTHLVRAVRGVPTRSSMTVVLLSDRPPVPGFGAHLFGDERLRLSGAWVTPDAGDGMWGVCARIPCWPDDPIMDLSDVEVADLVLDDFGYAGLPQLDPVAVATLRRHRSEPVYLPGMPALVGELLDWMDDLPGFVHLGSEGRAVSGDLGTQLRLGWRRATAVTRRAPPETVGVGLGGRTPRGARNTVR